MSPSIFAQKLAIVKQSNLGISALAWSSSAEDKAIVTVALNSGVSSHMFLMNVASEFPELSPAMYEDKLTLGSLTLMITSSAPGRCHFSVQTLNT